MGEQELYPYFVYCFDPTTGESGAMPFTTSDPSNDAVESKAASMLYFHDLSAVVWAVYRSPNNSMTMDTSRFVLANNHLHMPISESMFKKFSSTRPEA